MLALSAEAYAAIHGDALSFLSAIPSPDRILAALIRIFP
jgi:hypothetical protein